MTLLSPRLLAALAPLALPSSSNNWQFSRVTSFLCMGRDSAELTEGFSCTASSSTHLSASRYGSTSSGCNSGGRVRYLCGTSPEPMSWSRAVFTGRAARLLTPIAVLSKGHCLLCSDSRQGLHTVCPQARETGGFFVASNSCLQTGQERYSDHWGPWTGILGIYIL